MEPWGWWQERLLQNAHNVCSCRKLSIPGSGSGEDPDFPCTKKPLGWVSWRGDRAAGMVELVPTEGFACVAVPVLLLCSQGPSPPASWETPGRSGWRPAPSSASSALWDTRLWQHLLAPGVTSSEKMEIFSASRM